MTTLREAAALALEALDAYSWEQVNAARTALRTALAESRDSTKTVVESEQRTEPEQEPVAWRNVLPGGRITDKWESARIADYNQGWNDYRKAARDALEKAHTHPAPHPVTLTDEEIKYATLEQQNHLLDHIYEYGVSAEGVTQRIYKLARAVIEAYQRKQEGKA